MKFSKDTRPLHRSGYPLFIKVRCNYKMMLGQCIETSLKLEIVKNKCKSVETFSSGKLSKDKFYL